MAPLHWLRSGHIPDGVGSLPRLPRPELDTFLSCHCIVYRNIGNLRIASPLAWVVERKVWPEDTSGAKALAGRNQWSGPQGSHRFWCVQSSTLIISLRSDPWGCWGHKQMQPMSSLKSFMLLALLWHRCGPDVQSMSIPSLYLILISVFLSHFLVSLLSCFSVFSLPCLFSQFRVSIGDYWCTPHAQNPCLAPNKNLQQWCWLSRMSLIRRKLRIAQSFPKHFFL